MTENTIGKIIQQYLSLFAYGRMKYETFDKETALEFALQKKCLVN